MHAYPFSNTQIKCSALIFSKKLAVAAAAAFHSSCGWWKPRAFPFAPASRKRYRYRNYASYDDVTNGSTNFSIASTNKTKANSYQLRVQSPEEMEMVSGMISQLSTPGDVILLEGELGVGKTCWARGFIRAILANDDARITSPTYLLSNTYKTTIVVEDEDGITEEESISIHHMDLYRLSGKDPKELVPLALDHVFDSCISLIEWPDRLGTILEERVEKYDQNVLCVNLYYAPNSKGITQETANCNCSNLRTVELIPRGSCWKERLHSLLSDTGGLTNFFIK